MFIFDVTNEKDYEGLDYTVMYIDDEIYQLFYRWYNTKIPILDYTDFPGHAFKLSESDTIEMIEKFGGYITKW